MPPKNSKAAAALEKKAVVEAGKASAKKSLVEAAESQSWKSGSKDLSAKENEENKRLEILARKAESAALLAAEEAAIPSKPKKGDAKKPPARSGNIDAFLGGGNVAPGVDAFSASGIDGAMDLLSLATKGTDACNNDKLERHPEKRVKSAFAAFEEREMALLKEENPSLRLSQLKQALQKKWKKSPENPMNQAHVAFDTTRDEEKDAISAKREDALSHYKTQK
ncbi:hypothetical protein BASA50_006732 [Batrachochytrium salamandrivorans]|uniref:HMG box domain-containing protein n=1 Tax=Batrachochytrium salamandrivorans TaxID=1357716 RepID=A0ABQ8F9E6_9FUNG|nr:hypothetical protein BASA60_006903 [Batrachochytrium salamandrivorans]KAH6576448.1 hypothetical protein BASA62_001369 [Batrachochytrium salamandrivorans]KAH6590487.1 hypothetical protein BASA61_005246 [Batrachochytrium salamandrivorans]KAH6594260.1 hypothetical protein BASA50_006732 [Batrachochytrium salamandrivorans]KAH9270057.1 hypothetical protein BASA83_007887 [Batrachochytrium salamandrivorans]